MEGQEEKDVIVLVREAEGIEQFRRNAVLLKIFSCSIFWTIRIETNIYSQERRRWGEEEKEGGESLGVREVVGFAGGGVGRKEEKENSRLLSSDPAVENMISGPCLPGLNNCPGGQRSSQVLPRTCVSLPSTFVSCGEGLGRRGKI